MATSISSQTASPWSWAAARLRPSAASFTFSIKPRCFEPVEYRREVLTAEHQEADQSFTAHALVADAGPGQCTHHAIAGRARKLAPPPLFAVLMHLVEL